MSPRDLVYLGHMLDMAKKAVSKTAGLSREAYDADENLRLALIHLVQVIGEAGRRVSPEFRRTVASRLRWPMNSASECPGTIQSRHGQPQCLIFHVRGAVRMDGRRCEKGRRVRFRPYPAFI